MITRRNAIVFAMGLITLILIGLILWTRFGKGPTQAAVLATYKEEVKKIDQEWNKFDCITNITEESLQKAINVIVSSRRGGESLTEIQRVELEKSLMRCVRAYSVGTYEAYKDFRIPPGVGFSWASNDLGTLDLALQKGKTIALPKALERWRDNFRKKTTDVKDWSTEDKFKAYLKLYGGDLFYSNYVTGVCPGQSEIVVSSLSTSPAIPPWKISFGGVTNDATYATAQVNFLNMGYMSQSRYSFISLTNRLKTRLEQGTATVIADSFLFLKRQDADGHLPVILRSFWDPKLNVWVPDDLVVCNMESKGDFWPVF